MARPTCHLQVHIDPRHGSKTGAPENPGLRVVPAASRRICLSCGIPIDLKRRYCSVACRQLLHTKLDRRTGLLAALNTRYATFHFTSTEVVLTLLPFDSREIFSYIHPRRGNGTPGDDFCRLADRLSGSWWKENHKTQRRYLASRTILGMADRRSRITDPVKPMETRRPVLAGRSLSCLRLSRADLDSPDCIEAIKKAFRAQALRHHPDRGGRAEMFRKIFTAYRDLVAWAENPTFSRRIGFHDRWFYDGRQNRWVQPTPGPQHGGENKK